MGGERERYRYEIRMENKEGITSRFPAIVALIRAGKSPAVTFGSAFASRTKY